VLDHRRRPKLGYEALRTSCQPVLIVADWPPAVLRPGQEVALDVHVVNDRRIALTDMVASVHLTWRKPSGTGRPARGSADEPYEAPADRSPASTASRGPAEWARGGASAAAGPAEGEHWWWFRGDAPADRVVRVGSIGFVAPLTPAELVVRLELTSDDGTDRGEGGAPVRNEYRSRVG
jgi:hypothetical protein